MRSLFFGLGALATFGACAYGSDGAGLLDTSAPDAGAPPPPAADSSVPPPPTSAGGDAATPSAPDAGTDAPAVIPDAGCASTMAILAGNGTSAVAAIWSGGAWSAPQALTTSLASAPALVSTGASFVGVLRPSNGALQFTRSAGASWSSPAAVSGATSQGAPALAAIAGAAHLVYWGDDGRFYHGVYANNAWDAANDPVGGAASQSFGPSAPAASALGSGLSVAQVGQDGNVYAQAWNATWSPAQPVPGGAYGSPNASPRIVALGGGEGLIVYSHSDGLLMYAPTNGARFTTANALYNTAGASAAATSAPVALAPLQNGGALLVYVSDDGAAHYSIRDRSAAPAWTPPAALPTGGAPLSRPEVAPGVCGDDAIAAYATASGVSVMSYRAGTWSAPSPIAGTTGATFVTIATRP